MHTCEFCIQVWLCWCRIIFGSVRMLIAVKPCNQLIARGCSNFRSDFECCCHKIFDKIKFQDPWTTTEKNPEGVKSTHTQKRLPFFSWRWNLCVYFLRSFRLNLRVFSASIVGSSEISLESSIWRQFLVKLQGEGKSPFPTCGRTCRESFAWIKTLLSPK